MQSLVCLLKLWENGIEEIWAEAENKASTLGLKDPILLWPQKIPGRTSHSSTDIEHIYHSPKD